MGFMFSLSCAAGLAVPARGDELRGAWVTAWNPGFFTPAEADATIKAAKDANLNALFVQVRKAADAYYNSTLEPHAADFAPDFDPLAYIIDKAQAEGIQVHAWLNVYRVWKDEEMPSDPNHLVNRHPDWLNKTASGAVRASEGIYVDPGVPEARDHFASVVAEVASRYDVDGIHLDYIRYPGREWGYSDAALSRYYAQAGSTTRPKPDDPKWLRWRRDQVTEMVKMVRERVRAAKPNVRLSAATIAWGDRPASFYASSPYAKVCQDWRSWLANGLLDANVPMNYKVETSSNAAREFRNWLSGFEKWSAGKPVYVGIAVYSNEVADTVKQIEAVRKARHDGFVLFSFNQSARRAALVNALKKGPCSASAPVPSAPPPKPSS